MMAILKALFYVPLYNGLVFLIGVLPGGSVGLAVILFTVIIKTILFPLSFRASKFQFEMRAHEIELNKIKERFKNNKQEQGRAVLDFYREKGINPFAGILPLFIQIPIIIALYYVFYKGGFPNIDSSLLYGFVHVPEVNMSFLGMDIGAKSLLLAILVALTQFVQARYSLPPQKPKDPGGKPSLQDDIARGMHLQMKYFLPVFMGFVSYALSGAVALYFITSNLFTVGQELYIRKKFKSGHLTHGDGVLKPEP